MLPTPVFWPGELHGLFSPWGRKESDMTERLSLSLSCFSNRLGLPLCSQGPLCFRISPQLGLCAASLLLLIHPLSCASLERLAFSGLHPELPGFRFPF